MHASNQLWHTDPGENVPVEVSVTTGGGYWLDIGGRVAIHFRAIDDLNRFAEYVRAAAAGVYPNNQGETAT